MPSHHINTISKPTFNHILSRYKSTVPAPLQNLDTQRYDTIPCALATRKPSNNHLTKPEVEKLVEWKLKHGTFRPKLLALVQSNPADVVEKTTALAFALGEKDALSGIKMLTNLKGVGPATASLLLSVAQPGRVPFFSDELFRWAVWDEAGSPGGWGRKIKYNIKEYEVLLEKVDRLVQRLGAEAVDVERVAWVLGKEGVVIDDEEQGIGGEEKDEMFEDHAEEDVKEKVSRKQTTKRKASEMKPAVQGTRKSTRTKK